MKGPTLRSIAGLLLAFALCGCSQPLTVEQQIIATIRAMEAKVEDGQRLAFMEHIADDFSGQRGAMNRDQLRAYVVFQFNRYKNLQAQLLPIRVEETGEGKASAEFSALVTGGPNWIPDSGQVFDFETHWRLEDGEWLLESANWTPTPLDDVL